MSQEHSTINIVPSSSQESGLPNRIDNSLEIAMGLRQLQAIGDLMSVSSDEGLEDGNLVVLGQLLRDRAEEIRELYEEEDHYRNNLIQELKRKV
jgi:hypothetical protein